MSSHKHDFAQLKARLEGQAESLVLSLLGEPTAKGPRYWRWGRNHSLSFDFRLLPWQWAVPGPLPVELPSKFLPSITPKLLFSLLIASWVRRRRIGVRLVCGRCRLRT